MMAAALLRDLRARFSIGRPGGVGRHRRDARKSLIETSLELTLNMAFR
jgi:hypothetical protein